MSEAQEIQTAVEKGLKAGFKAREEQKSAFRVDPERHYKHHNFIDEALEFFAESRKTALRSVIAAFVMGVLSLIGLGIGAFFYLKSGGPT